MRNLKLTPILLLAALLVASCGKSRVSESELKSEISRIPMIYTVEAVAQVNIEETDAETSLLSFFGNRNIIVPIKANLKAGIDLSKLDDISIEGDKVYITLPDPVIEIESTKILHDQMITDVTGFRDDFKSSEEAKLAKVGREKIEANLSKFGLIEPAQDQAEQILTGIISKLGYTASFKARPTYSEMELVKFIKR